MAASALWEPNMRTALRLPLSPIYIQGGFRLWGAMRLPALTNLNSAAPVLLSVVLVQDRADYWHCSAMLFFWGMLQASATAWGATTTALCAREPSWACACSARRREGCSAWAVSPRDCTPGSSAPSLSHQRHWVRWQT